MTMWMVRAETGGRLFGRFLEKGAVAIGWPDLGDLSRYTSRDALAAAMAAAYPEGKARSRATAVGTLARFLFDMRSGDRVVTYDPQRRVYALGTIWGGYRYDPNFDPLDPNLRPVSWEVRALSRDRVSVGTKNSLGSVLTLFKLPAEAEAEILRVAEGAGTAPAAEPGDAGTDPEAADAEAASDLLHDIEARSIEFIKDRIVRLGWDELQEITAGVLRAMGYKARVSPAGPDRGKDIVASPDGFGFEDPRIMVEVKHRPQTPMGAQAIRSFLGGRHPGDKGLYVSTGGFSKDAQYEAERANIPVTLMDLDSLVAAVLDNYPNMDTETQRLLPLKRIFWPLG
jgi:restriction system protein